MRHKKRASRSADQLKDEVYRQMLRVEGGCPAAELHLALALLRAWMTLENDPSRSRSRQWLRAVCPVCQGMIEAAAATHRMENGKSSVQ